LRYSPANTANIIFFAFESKKKNKTPGMSGRHDPDLHAARRLRI